MKKLDKPANIAVILLLLVLMPMLFYTAYELTALNTTEQLLGDIYERQLDAILFSVNQHAWDVVNSWANLVAERHLISKPDSIALFLGERDSAMQALFFADSIGTISHIVGNSGDTHSRFSDSAYLAGTLSANKEKLTRLARYIRTGYRKLEPVDIESGQRDRRDAIVIFPVNSGGDISIAGFVLNADAFSRRVIGPKLLDVAGGEFVLGVLSAQRSVPVVSTGPVKTDELQQQKALWLFPNQTLGIGLKGTTVAEVVRGRTVRNIILIIIIDVVLLAGVWFVYRTIRREMELVRLKSDLISNVSHELRTPLALIRMFGETLEMGRVKSDEKKMEYYGTIVKESERLTRLVNNILDFSKMEAGKKQYTFQETDVNAVVSAVMTTYSYHLQSKGISPVVRLGAGLSGIKADSEAVTEAIINLLDNAIKYGGEEKFIRVETRMNGSSIVVEVEDRGVGIAPEHQEKIFDTFYRVSGSLVHNTKGSGLGLSLVKHIMDAHNGAVEVESTGGQGSTFRLLFPAVHSQEES